MGTAAHQIKEDTGAAKVSRRPNSGSRAVGHRDPDERRSNQRFELALEFDLFQLRGADRLAWHSTGITVDWSRNSVLVRGGRNLAAGSSAQMVVRWVAGVQLIVVGRAIRSDERGTVIKILRRRFRGKPLAIVPLSQLINWQPSGQPN